MEKDMKREHVEELKRATEKRFLVVRIPPRAIYRSFLQAFVGDHRSNKYKYVSTLFFLSLDGFKTFGILFRHSYITVSKQFNFRFTKL